MGFADLKSDFVFRSGALDSGPGATSRIYLMSGEV